MGRRDAETWEAGRGRMHRSLLSPVCNRAITTVSADRDRRWRLRSQTEAADCRKNDESQGGRPQFRYDRDGHARARASLHDSHLFGV